MASVRRLAHSPLESLSHWRRRWGVDQQLPHWHAAAAPAHGATASAAPAVAALLSCRSVHCSSAASRRHPFCLWIATVQSRILQQQPAGWDGAAASSPSRQASRLEAKACEASRWWVGWSASGACRHSARAAQEQHCRGVEGRAAPRVAPHAVGSPWRPAGQPLANPPVGVAQGILSPQLLVHQAGGGCCNGGCLVWVAPRPVHRGQQIAVVGPEESERQPPNVVGAAQRRAASANGPHRGCRLAPAPSA